MSSFPPFQPDDSEKGKDGTPVITPDFVEQDWPEEIDEIVPSRGYDMAPMVGLGGSAGGIRALTEFFKAMPADSGMVFVVILHLSPTHESTMAELLGRATSMPVMQAEDGQQVQPNHVYVIPPGKYLTAVNEHLRLFDLKTDRGKRVAVDLFFRSLADTHGPHALAVILSGADSDGALGIKRIKERGGLTIAQDPDEAEHSGMPRAAIDTGMVDWVLSVSQIPKRLLEYRDNEVRLELPPEEGPPLAPPPRPKADEDEKALREVLLFLRMRTGRDFSYYKLTTVNQEMKNKMDELANANSDLQNLMASTSIATVFLDRNLSITRFTPSAVGIFNLIPGDIGRPLAHLRHRLEYPGLMDDAEEVLRTLVPLEREVRGDGAVYFVRLQPYRTLEHHIAGVVLTLVDVTERNRATEALRQSQEWMRVLIENAKDHAIFTTDLDGRINSWNVGAQAMFGYAESEILGQQADLLFTPEDRAKGEPEREARLARDEDRAANERWHVRKDSSIFYGSGSVMPLREKSGALRGFLKIIRDLTEFKRTEEELRENVDELMRFNAVATGRETRMIELKKEINELCGRLGEAPRYAPEVDDHEGSSE